MERFYWIVILIALLALIGILTYIGILMTYYRYKDTTYPPVAASCPDLWMVSPTNPNICRIPTYSDKAINVGSTYVPALPDSNDPPNFQLNESNTHGINMTTKDIDFTGSHWASTCTKQSWANTYGLVWDGVTNFNGC